MATKVVKCSAHGETTRLTCVECGEGICPRCLVRTEVGLKCGRCAEPVPVKVDGLRRSWGPAALVGGALLVLAAGAMLVRGGGSSSPDPDAQAVVNPVGSWEAAPDLPSLRGTAVAMVLPDGRVLVVGGGVSAIPLGATEVFDPARGAWAKSGDLAQPRRGHAGVVLADGRALVSGGIAEGELLATAEVYDPAAGHWQPSGPMTTPRLGHALTLLPDGRVLATGGTTPGAQQGAGGGQTIRPDSTAEVWDPATSAWTAVAPMRSARFEHTAIALQDGRVLVAGGLGSPGGGQASPLPTSELFDPAAGVFVESGRMAEGRSNHAAARLEDGTVLVAGGAGGAAGDVSLASAERYDPRRGTWTREEGMRHPRTGLSAALVAGGRVVVAGGEAVERGVRRALSSAEVFDPAEGVWLPAGEMRCPRSEQAAVALADGSALVVAGDATFPGEPPIAQACVERYRP